MTPSTDNPYRMTVGLEVLKHLGFGLYSNVPAVLAEVVANAWDADAQHVFIEIDTENDRITIRDDGHGMTVQDANDRYLYVGYERRGVASTARSPQLDRPVMGRKGIGKLSLFSIANRVTVHSKRDGQVHGFIMDAKAIEKAIKANDRRPSEGERPAPEAAPAEPPDGDPSVAETATAGDQSALEPDPVAVEAAPSGEYKPEPVDPSTIHIPTESGTTIVLSDLKRRVHHSAPWLRRRLARRFSIIGEANQFEIDLNGTPITIEDRGYYDKLQYIWTFGERGASAADAAGLEPVVRPDEVAGDDGYRIEGWIGVTHRAGDLKGDDNESLNAIVIMVRGKLAQEDILDEFGEGGVYSKYVIGEVHADFLDLDDQEDVQTTSRQRIIEDDPRYRALRTKIREELKVIQNIWTKLRNEKGKDEALKIPQLDEWYGSLAAEYQGPATRLFGKINQLPIENPVEKRQLFISSVLAFESLRFRHLLDRIDELSVENLSGLGSVFGQLDDLEASAYYQISRDRLAVIEKLTTLVDDNAKERAMQEHLFQHLWLLDPSWERATATARMEQSVKAALDGVAAELSDEQLRARLDIRYQTTGNKHVVIELKRAGRIVDTGDLVVQIQKYNGAVREALDALGKEDEPLEFICVVGRPLRDWSRRNGREISARTLAGQDARVVMYDALIVNAQQAYEDYLDRQEEAGRVYDLITSISAADVEAIHAAAAGSADAPPA